MNRFVFDVHGVLDRVIVPCTIDVRDYDVSTEAEEKIVTVKALWDTGSTVTVLTDNLVQRLGLIASDITRVSGWDGTPITTNKYSIDIKLGDVLVEFVNAVRGPLKNVDMIIGMDVIGQGDMHLTHPSFSTLLEFNLN